MSKWPLIALGDIFEIARGGSPRPIDNFITDDPDGINWVMIGDASEGSKYISSTKKRIIKDGAKKSRMVHPGDFLLTNSMSFGKPYIMNTTGCIHDGWLVLSPKSDNVNSDYMFHALGSEIIYSEFSRLAAGATVKNLNTDLVKGVKVALPPLNEQRRIAAILDQAELLRAKRRQALAKLDELGRSIFLEMFGDPGSNPKKWPLISLKSFFNFRTGKLDSNAAIKDGKYPFFTCSKEDFRINEYAFDCEALLLAGNNANADYSVKHYQGKFNAYQRTYVLTLKDEENYYIYAKAVLERKLIDLKRLSKGTSTKYLTLGILEDMKIQLPPISLQSQFASQIESINRIKTTQRAALAKLDALFASLQHRAFRGELWGRFKSPPQFPKAYTR